MGGPAASDLVDSNLPLVTRELARCCAKSLSDRSSDRSSDGSYMPINNAVAPFTGQFEGQGHSITSLRFEASFGRLAPHLRRDTARGGCVCLIEHPQNIMAYGTTSRFERLRAGVAAGDI